MLPAPALVTVPARADIATATAVGGIALEIDAFAVAAVLAEGAAGSARDGVALLVEGLDDSVARHGGWIVGDRNLFARNINRASPDTGEAPDLLLDRHLAMIAADVGCGEGDAARAQPHCVERLQQDGAPQLLAVCSGALIRTSQRGGAIQPG